MNAHNTAPTAKKPKALSQPAHPPQDMPLKGIRPNIVQSIRAFHPRDLQDIAAQLGQHFLYANLSAAQTKQEVLEMIASQFTFPPHFGKNFDALYDCMTDPLHKAGPQPGFIVVLEHIPATQKFDKEMREQLIDIFREAADYWADRKVSFRCFYSFSVARSTQGGQAGRAGDAQASARAEDESGEKIPTDKLLDISAQALRMSSPFNVYWSGAS